MITRKLFLQSLFLAFISAFTGNAQNDWIPTGGPEGSTSTLDLFSNSQYLFAQQFNFLYRSDGLRWERIENEDFASTYTYKDIQATDELLAYISPAEKEIHLSTDQGETWSSVALTFEGIASIYLHGNSIFLKLINAQNESIYRSDDMAKTWLLLEEKRSNVVMPSFSLNGKIYRTDGIDIWESTDLGELWTISVPSPPLLSSKIIDFVIDEEVIVIVGTDRLLYSFDSGTMWHTIYLNEYSNEYKVVNTDDDIFIYSHVLHVINKVAQTVELVMDEVFDISRLKATGLGHELFVSPKNNHIHKYQSTTQSFLTHIDGLDQLTINDFDVTDEHVWASSEQGLFHYTIAQDLWEKIEIPFIQVEPFHLIGASDNGLVVVTTESHERILYVSKNFGEDWEIIEPQPEGQPLVIHSLEVIDGVIFIYDILEEELWISYDEGSTWQSQPIRLGHRHIQRHEDKLVIWARAGLAYLSSDLGRTWDIHQMNPIHIFRSCSKKYFYVIGEIEGKFGIYRSKDLENWEDVSLGFPDISQFYYFPGEFDSSDNIMFYSDGNESVITHDGSHAYFDENIKSWVRLSAYIQPRHLEYNDDFIFAGGYGIYKNELDFSVDVSNAEIRNTPLNIFPNPSDGNIHIRSEYDIISVSIYDLDGRLLIFKRMNASSGKSIDFVLPERLKGMMHFEVITTSGRETKRVMVQ